ncbi:MAG: hypothetical protein FD127_3355 [Acidimicrobiaceae bacterium]|nr:MAG: hypothetical protein FD127_3355 [Acidimicrobiaceae bacterium]
MGRSTVRRLARSHSSVTARWLESPQPIDLSCVEIHIQIKGAFGADGVGRLVPRPPAPCPGLPSGVDDPHGVSPQSRSRPRPQSPVTHLTVHVHTHHVGQHIGALRAVLGAVASRHRNSPRIAQVNRVRTKLTTEPPSMRSKSHSGLQTTIRHPSRPGSVTLPPCWGLRPLTTSPPGTVDTTTTDAHPTCRPTRREEHLPPGPTPQHAPPQ